MGSYAILRITVFITTMILALSGCNWVDSTGRQENLDPTLSLKDGDIISRNEEELVNLDASASDEDGLVQSYEWSSAGAEGALNVCGDVLDLDITASSLDEVCEDEQGCDLVFLPQDDSPGQFTVMLPKLRGPIGLTHQLVVRDNDGGKTELNIHFCIDSVNEAPVAANDAYSVTEGSSLTVTANDTNHLLANDTDDEDVRNQGLVVTGIAGGQEPEYAEEFDLKADGGFTYSISPRTPFTVTQDSFSYEVWDGEHTSTATVTLDLSVNDDPPRTLGFIPDQQARIGLFFGPLDLSGRFFDPERSELTFAAAGLPDGITIASQTGIISGTATAGNSASDYVVTVSASDGRNTVQHNPFTLTLLENRSPQVVAVIADQTATVGAAFSVDTSDAFEDEDGNVLSFSATGLPSGLTIDATSGVISGTPATATEGVYVVSVSANDGIASATTDFNLTVVAQATNQPPVFTAPSSVPAANIGLPYSLDVSAWFADPEGDTLSFTASGLPASGNLTISEAGLISGTPTEEDRAFVFGHNVTITADDGNGNQTSGEIQLRVQ